jgi:hypothetical protein
MQQTMASQPHAEEQTGITRSEGSHTPSESSDTLRRETDIANGEAEIIQ